MDKEILSAEEIQRKELISQLIYACYDKYDFLKDGESADDMIERYCNEYLHSDDSIDTIKEQIVSDVLSRRNETSQDVHVNVPSDMTEDQLGAMMDEYNDLAQKKAQDSIGPQKRLGGISDDSVGDDDNNYGYALSNSLTTLSLISLVLIFIGLFIVLLIKM